MLMIDYKNFIYCIPLIDKIIINEFFNSNGKINVNKIKDNYLNKHQFLKNYLVYRFNDSESINETIYRIKNKIELRPVCLNCGGNVKYINNGKFNNYCSHKCRTDSHLVKQKRNATNIDRYGGLAPASNKNVVEKMLKTREDRYGSKSYHNIEKYKETMLNKYGVDHNFKCDKVIKQREQTWLNNYNCYNPSQSEKIKNKKRETCIKHFGVDSYFKTTEFKQFFNDNKDWIIEKIFKTQKENGTLGKSKIEDEIYNLIKIQYPDTIHHYKDDFRYPFNCDFYIPSLDLFIEYNGHWTHGPHLFNENNMEDVKLLNECKDKSLTSDYYCKMIDTWTIRDPLKVKTAKENNLNYLILWPADYDNNKILDKIKERS